MWAHTIGGPCENSLLELVPDPALVWGLSQRGLLEQKK